MLRFTLKGLAAHRLRALGIAVAVFLGVALVSGTYILTDTINRSFDDIFTEANAGTDVVVTSRQVVQQDDDTTPPFDADVLPRVEAVDGVERAAGSVFALVRLVDERGDKLAGSEFAPNFVFSVLPAPFETLTVDEGGFPANDREAALDSATAERNDLGVGDTIGVAGSTMSRSRRS